MSKALVCDELWETVEPLLPEEPPKPRGGRPRLDDRATLAGIVFVLKSGIPWEMLPQEMGCGSGSTCWRRLRDWQEAGVWEELHGVLLDRLGDAERIDWERTSLDSASVPAKRGPKDQAEFDGSRQTGLEASRCFGPRDVPLAVVLTATNVRDSKVLGEAVDAVSPIKRPRGKSGRPRKRPEKSCTPTRPTIFPLRQGFERGV